MADPDSKQNSAATDGRRAENSIRPSAKRRKGGNAETPAPVAATPSQTSAKPTHAVPAEVRDRFVVVKNKYYFPDGTRAFADRGTRLTTASENTEVIRSLIQIAEARGWTEITVRGTEHFRKEAWFAGQLAGLEVRGYRPSEFEHGRLARTVARQGPAATEDSVTPGASGALAVDSGAPPRDELLTGRLVDHGRATYRHDPRQPMSYFVRLETERGDRTIWGLDLERAVKESLTRPDIGDEIGLRAVRQERVTVRKQERGAAGEVIDRELETHRNRWILERRDFFEGRAEVAQIVRDASLNPKEVARKHPELVGSLLQLHIARLAAQKLHPEDRERFVATHRSGLAERIARGEPLPVVRLRERARKPPERESAPVRG